MADRKAKREGGREKGGRSSEQKIKDFATRKK
jgi:hypothetical protein